MARAGVTVHETVNVTGHDAADVSARVSAALAATGAYHVVDLQQGRHQLVRTYRPTWVLVAGTAGLPLFGLGALFFLVRRTELCTISVTYGSTGSVLSIAGSLLRGHLDIATRAALDPSKARQQTVDLPVDLAEDPGAPALEPDLACPPAITGTTGFDSPVPSFVTNGISSSDVTVARTAVRPSEPCRITLQLTDGRRLPLAGRVVIGRDPSWWESSPESATLVAMDDPHMALSKTHLVITARTDALLVEDLYSTNGTEVAWPDGTRCALTPGEPLRLAAGAVVHFGGQAAEVVASG